MLRPGLGEPLPIENKLESYGFDGLLWGAFSNRKQIGKLCFGAWLGRCLSKREPIGKLWFQCLALVAFLSIENNLENDCFEALLGGALANRTPIGK